MPTSAARIAANKANAQKSTGPKSVEGKARVAENAMKHGLRSARNPLELTTDTCTRVEHEEFQITLSAFLDDLAPHGPIETRLVEHLAQIDLRLNRATRIETTLLDRHVGEFLHDANHAITPNASRHSDNVILAAAFFRDPSALKLITQYESRLRRDFARALTQLREAQKLRAKNEDQKPRLNSDEQTQLTPDQQHPTRSYPSDKVVSEIPVKQTQPRKEPRVSTSVTSGAPAQTHACAMTENPTEQTQAVPRNLTRQEDGI